MTDRRRLGSAVLAGAFLFGSALAQSPQATDNRSLGEIARELREKKRPDVQVTAQDAKELFAAVDQIANFASQKTGFTRRAAVKRQLLSRNDLERNMAGFYGANEEQERLVRSEMVLKKFGLLPPDFDLKSYLPKRSVDTLGAYYSPKEKTMYLLDWVPFEAQRPIMAHELTHALQDQNFDLAKFMKAGAKAKNDIPQMSVAGYDVQESALARRAIVEGQATLVYADYLMKDRGTSLADSPQLVERLLAGLQVYDAPVVLHNAPRILKDGSTFPYREGVVFELELLKKGGRDTAFAGVFARPPLSTHEILQPGDYLAKSKPPIVTIPDLRPILGDAYQAYDSGSMGELDVRILVRDFGTENDIYSVSPNWNGGAYVVVKRSTAANGSGASEVKPRTADLALLYLSRWKSFEAAKRVAQLYQRALPKRINVLQQDPVASRCQTPPACTDTAGNEALWAAKSNTDEGPVILEIWPGNTLLITHSFAESTMSQLRRAILPSILRQRIAPKSSAPGAAERMERELSAALYECDAFLALQEQVRRDIAEHLAAGLEQK